MRFMFNVDTGDMNAVLNGSMRMLECEMRTFRETAKSGKWPSVLWNFFATTLKYLNHTRVLCVFLDGDVMLNLL